MALGTNYARNPSRKQIEVFYRKCIRHSVKIGETKDAFLKQWKPTFQDYMSRLYDDEISKPVKKPRKTKKD